jgi:hypothetical protein
MHTAQKYRLATFKMSSTFFFWFDALIAYCRIHKLFGVSRDRRDTWSCSLSNVAAHFLLILSCWWRNHVFLTYFYFMFLFLSCFLDIKVLSLKTSLIFALEKSFLTENNFSYFFWRRALTLVIILWKYDRLLFKLLS